MCALNPKIHFRVTAKRKPAHKLHIRVTAEKQQEYKIHTRVTGKRKSIKSPPDPQKIRRASVSVIKDQRSAPLIAARKSSKDSKAGRSGLSALILSVDLKRKPARLARIMPRSL